MTQPPSPLVLTALLALALPAPAAAHGVRADVERRGTEIAVRARYESGRPLAGVRFEVTSPARPERAHAEGTTDRDGWVVFTPDAPGTWKVRIADATGHGRVVKVDVAPVPASVSPAPVPVPVPVPAPAPAPAASTPTPTSTPAPSSSPSTPEPAASRRAEPGLLLRTAGGVAVVALVFGGLYAAGRRRRAAGR